MNTIDNPAPVTGITYTAVSVVDDTMTQSGFFLAPDARQDNFFKVPFSAGHVFHGKPSVILSTEQSGGQYAQAMVADRGVDHFILWTNGYAPGYTINWVAIGRKG